MHEIFFSQNNLNLCCFAALTRNSWKLYQRLYGSINFFLSLLLLACGNRRNCDVMHGKVNCDTTYDVTLYNDFLKKLQDHIGYRASKR